jgi:hypothetical protein
MQLKKKTNKSRINVIWHRYGMNMEIEDPGISCAFIFTIFANLEIKLPLGGCLPDNKQAK